MTTFVILFVAFLVVGVLSIVGIRGQPAVYGENLVFRYSKASRIIVLLCFVSIWIVLIFSAIRNGMPDFNEFGFFHFVSAGLFVFGMPLLWVYLTVTRVVLTSNELIKSTLCIKTVLPYEEVKKIVHYHGGENPGAMMTKIHTSDRKVTLEALISGYSQLTWEIEGRCAKAVILDK